MGSWLLVIVATGFGALIGSFLNVVIYRLPRGESVVSPPSACTTCGHRIRGADNIPVLSWLVLRGKCRDCRAPIAIRYPVVELGTALFFGLVGAWTTSSLAGQSVVDINGAALAAVALRLVAFLYLAAVSVALALIDLETHRLPDKIVLPAYAVGAVLLGWAALVTGDLGRLLSAGIGLAALWLLYFLMAVLYPGGMGFGDVKLAGVLGLFLGWLGWGQLVVGAFSAFLLGGIFALILLVSRRVSRKGSIPFGPWMLAGAWVGIFAGDTIWHSYLALFGLA
ncbi:MULTISPECIES: A24 family peptidase [unclassified Cryobacterium]|uniref:prepilin peptidase n=1 Tax=unclassified Cryobacterium TaxID=2649013 RepID=UPI00106D9B39|nr:MULTISPECIES: A24 family peptidase [unclassified Cryobacterium]TFC56944.1 prepilin peptidase [Cryobacterium sp. TMB3-1-2]TFC67901.1 prepilin peptidase [Cryobacterium sp. TMB3-15]TFC76820.1 prepilin peptidase [Cryobacterium sp. TMB3-10]TFD42237.1 prepilin peptidase [Cryobacterium sp. TMB3-12]